MKAVLFALAVIFSEVGWSFPDLVRHGYTHCGICHASASGGDLTTSYGRELGKELVFPKETLFESDLPLPEIENLRLKLNNRWLQTYLDNSQVSKGRFLLMQLDLDASYLIDGWTFYVSAGRFEPPAAEKTWSDFVYFPRLWVRYSLNIQASEVTFRLGRFLPAYGIHFAEHTFVTRQSLAFGPGQERKAVELAWTTPNWHLNLTRIDGRQIFSDLLDERGWAAQVSALLEKSRLGLNLYRTEGRTIGKSFYDGVFLLLGLNEISTLLFELDRLYLSNGKTGYTGLVRYHREVKRGLQAFTTVEYKNTDIERTQPHFEAFGVGGQWFVNSALNLTLHFRLEKDTRNFDEFQKVAWFLLQLAPN